MTEARRRAFKPQDRHIRDTALGGVSYYDLERHLPDGRVLAGPLEDAPQGCSKFAITSPPGWLRWA